MKQIKHYLVNNKNIILRTIIIYILGIITTILTVAFNLVALPFENRKINSDQQEVIDSIVRESYNYSIKIEKELVKLDKKKVDIKVFNEFKEGQDRIIELLLEIKNNK